MITATTREIDLKSRTQPIVQLDSSFMMENSVDSEHNELKSNTRRSLESQPHWAKESKRRRNDRLSKRDNPALNNPSLEVTSGSSRFDH